MTEPTTVTEFLHKHGLPYAAAFEENGHDHLPSLLEASEEDLATVISDVKMLSGHAMRLRKILGKSSATHVSATPLASSPPPPAAEPPASAPQSDPAQLRGDDPNAQAHMHKLLMAQNPFGNFIHGNIAETYCEPVTEKPTVIMANTKRFYCGICPAPARSSDDTRACGTSFSNVWLHLGSRVHWAAYRAKYLKLSNDEAAWLKFTAGNEHGPRRNLVKKDGKPTKQAANREAEKELKGSKRRKGSPSTPSAGQVPPPPPPPPPLSQPPPPLQQPPQPMPRQPPAPQQQEEPAPLPPKPPQPPQPPSLEGQETESLDAGDSDDEDLFTDGTSSPISKKRGVTAPEAAAAPLEAAAALAAPGALDTLAETSTAEDQAEGGAAEDEAPAEKEQQLAPAAETKQAAPADETDKEADAAEGERGATVEPAALPTPAGEASAAVATPTTPAASMGWGAAAFGASYGEATARSY